MLHITDLLGRFTNTALKDTCNRVGGDPARKLSTADRLIGASSLALEIGVTPAYIAIGVAAGLRRYINEAEGMQQSEEAAKTVLRNVSKLDTDGELAQLILSMYKMIIEEKSFGEIRREADLIVVSKLNNVI